MTSQGNDQGFQFILLFSHTVVHTFQMCLNLQCSLEQPACSHHYCCPQTVSCYPLPSQFLISYPRPTDPCLKFPREILPACKQRTVSSGLDMLSGPSILVCLKDSIIKTQNFLNGKANPAF